MDTINKIKKNITISDLKTVKQPNKVNSNYFDVFFFEKKGWRKREALSIKKINKNSLYLVDEYLSVLEKWNLSPYSLGFKDYINSKEIIDENHFIGSLIKQSYAVEARLTPVIGDYENKIANSYNTLVNIEKQHEIKISTWVFNIESISDDIYGTTTMEWEIVDKEFIEKILNNKNISWKSLSEKEAINIRNGFMWAIENSLKDIKLSKELINEVHEINTRWLDTYVNKGLKYNPWENRDYMVNMGIFQAVNWKTWYTPPEIPDKYIEELIEYFNTWDLNIVKLANLHLILYAIHPFSNWNKRTTRVLESLYIQKKYDKWHYFKWMWYWFKKNIKTYLKQVRDVLSWKNSLKDWNLFYMNSFIDMCKYSIYEAQHLKEDISKNVPANRLRYYNDTDKVFYRFYLKNKDRLFSTRDIFLYLAKNDIEYSDEKQVTKRLSKHIKDNLISKTDQKIWKRSLYKFNINK